MVARNCTKIFSDLSVKKHLVLFFVGFDKVKILLFFESWVFQSSISIHCPIDHTRRVCCAFLNVISMKSLNKFRKQSIRQRVPKKTGERHNNRFFGSYL